MLCASRSVRLPLASGLAALLVAGTALEAFADVRISTPGRWRKHRPPPSAAELTEAQRAAIEELDAVGYLSGSRPGAARHGVIVHRPDAVGPGVNLYVAGHAAEAILMESDGTVLHTWSYAYEDLPSRPEDDGKRNRALEYWRRVHLSENGDLLAIFEGEGLLKIDRESRLLWYRPNGAHHDLEVLDDGDIVVLTREAGVVPWIHPERPVLEDFLSRLDPDGEEKERLSLAEAFRDTEFESYWHDTERFTGDIFHTNSVQVLEGRIADRVPAFRAGSVLTSMRYLDTIAVVDPRRGEVTWALRGTFRRQHDPAVVDSGRILVFDNGLDRDFSEVLELDPVTGETVWSYRGSPEAPFQTDTCGTAQRLPNGNTLITESDNGRAFEVDRDGEIVWEFVCPHRARRMPDYIATLFEVVRLPEDFPLDWIDGE